MTEPTPAFAYILLWGGLTVFLLVIAGGITASRLTKWAGQRRTRRAVAEADNTEAKLRLLRSTPDHLMSDKVWAELTRLEFAQSYATSGIAEQIERVGQVADATLAEMRKRWKLTNADLRRAADGHSNHAARFHARLRDLIKTENAAQVRQQWADAILSPTRPMPIYRPQRKAVV